MQKIVYVKSNSTHDGLDEVNKLLADGIWEIVHVSPCALSDGGSSAYITLQRHNTIKERDRRMNFFQNQ